jgi:hypothetical protein
MIIIETLQDLLECPAFVVTVVMIETGTKDRAEQREIA